MTTYRLGSSPAVHTPGIIAWAINGYAFEKDRAQMVKVVCDTFPNLPTSAARQLLSKEVAYTVENETVVFSVEDESHV
ncbi:hypothetical protein [uncultured Aliiroseovarius sp.]|uniref:hypothetical protein n=1 Tax=uncultured Aliiroseovarius sp. TaxID=1658783 RepID=UPI00261ADD41|nr:hypothetical protein [uncultured Aliiroseovarius sp.]